MNNKDLPFIPANETFDWQLSEEEEALYWEEYFKNLDREQEEYEHCTHLNPKRYEQEISLHS
ncbi:MAG: hypothetical protein HC836_41215 [Richelia sp. RM2_1_2]|nr:hypothetical protein [Richelia sp. RM2_1_2]